MKHNKYIIGVDGGSQSTKVVIYDLYGNKISEGKQPLKPMHTPGDGIVEHPDDDLWNSLIHASQKALERFPGNKEEIIGVGLCTIRFCRCLLKKNGELAAPAMSWMDDRVSKPYEHTNKETAYVTTSSGYITHRLTGEFKDTSANYQGMWPIDTDNWEWSKDQTVLNYFNIPREMLFDLQPPGSILGHLTKEASEATGIPKNIPVIATANDKAVEALGAGLLNENTALISLGTYIAGMVPSEKNIKKTTDYWTNFASVPGKYLLESNGIRRGMWTISWFMSLFGEDLIKRAEAEQLTPEALLNREAELNVPAGSDGLITILDWLAPSDKTFRKGMMIGFDERHTAAHMYHSILEGISMTMKNNLEALFAERKMNMKEVFVSGGGAKGDVLMQMMANVFGVPAKRNKIIDSASLGAAINAAVALNEYSTYSKAVEQMVSTKDIFSPDLEKHDFYKKLNTEVYRHVTDYTDELLMKLYSLKND
ncbi:FGGY-family carbohydrate kinase [Virgibacillus kimchii]